MINRKFWRIDNQEIKMIKKAVFAGLKGQYTSIFEKKLAKKFLNKYAISVNSGTSALHAALYSIGIQKGDEVIVPPLTFSATAFSVLYLGAKPVFADVDKKTFNISPIQISKKITNRTKAIITVSLFGLIPDMFKIKKIARKHKVKIIEDNAETIFSSQHGKYSGTFGDLSILSFQRSKHLTVGDGGAILTSNKKYYENAKKFSHLGYFNSTIKNFKKETIQNPNYLRHEFVAPNYRMPEIIAAAGISQLNKSKSLLKKRVYIGKLFIEILKKYNFINYQITPVGYVHSYWTVAFYFNYKKNLWKEFRKKFLSLGGDHFFSCWKLTYQEPALKKLSLNSSCPNAEFLQKRLILLKTNYYSKNYSIKQANVLDQTLKYFKKKYYDNI